MIASLMMYSRPEIEAETGRYWHAIRTALADYGIESPDALSNTSDPMAVWTAQDLVISQTCGMPYRTYLQEQVALIGTPDFDLNGCAPGYYNSALVVRADDPRSELANFRDAPFAYNQTDSQSGFAAPYAHATKHGFWFQNRVESGGHRSSAEFVAGQKADIAAIDAMTWRLIQRYDRFAANLRVLEWTAPTPGLPYITAQTDQADTMLRAVQQAISSLSADDRKALSLHGCVQIPNAVYLAVENPPSGKTS